MTGEEVKDALELYEKYCESFIKSGGKPICFGRLEGLQEMARILGLGDIFKPVRDKYMEEFRKFVI